MATNYIAELGTEGSTPALALSLLRNRIRAVEHRSDAGVTQVGIASGFHLADVGGRLALVCNLQLHDEKSGGEKLHAGDHPIIGAAGREQPKAVPEAKPPVASESPIQPTVSAHETTEISHG